MIDNRGDDANDNAIDDNCILAIVKDYNKHTNLYRVVDADPESKQTSVFDGGSVALYI